MGRFGLILQPGCVPAPRSAVVRSGAQRARIPRGSRAGPRAGTMEWHSREDAPPGIFIRSTRDLEQRKLRPLNFSLFQVSCQSEQNPRRSVFPNTKRIHPTQTYPYSYICRGAVRSLRISDFLLSVCANIYIQLSVDYYELMSY